MVQITVNDELARQIAGAQFPIVLVDERGRELAKLGPVDQDPSGQATMSDNEWAEIKRRMATDNGVRYTTAEVLEHLRTLAHQ